MAQIFSNKFYQASFFFVLFILFFIFVFIPSVNKINTDFPNYYVSANMFLENNDLKDAYDNVQFNKQVLFYGIENQIVSFIPYPPISALLMTPIARLEPLTAKLIWNSFNIIFFLLSTYFISKISGVNYFFTGILFFISGYAFANNFFFGQVYLLILLLFSASLYLLFKDKDTLSALLFSISVLLKFYTIFFLILFLCGKKFKMLLASLIFIVTLNLIAFAITGWDINLFYYSKIMPRISDGWVGTAFAPEFQSVTSLLHILFYNEPSLNPNPLIESPNLYFILKYLFYLGILLSSVFIVLHSDKKTFKLQISLFCFVCMLLLPVNASYQYVILVPAIAILINFYITEKQYFMIGMTLGLFFIMNSPIVVFIINVTKNKPYFFLGYIKLLILLYFWLTNFIILKRSDSKSISKTSLLRYSFAYAFLILIFSRMSLAMNNPKDGDATNILNTPSYMISMPSALNSSPDKIVFTECINEKFILNSNFGVLFDKENIFEPKFLYDDVVVYETIKEGRQQFKWLDLNTLRDTISKEFTQTNYIQYSKDGSLRCFSNNGQIYLQNFPENKITQLTCGNSFNTRPDFSENDSKIIFCSDRNRGVGFTTLYEIKIK